jgi:hypothetical protein
MKFGIEEFYRYLYFDWMIVMTALYEDVHVFLLVSLVYLDKYVSEQKMLSTTIVEKNESYFMFNTLFFICSLKV